MNVERLKRGARQFGEAIMQRLRSRKFLVRAGIALSIYACLGFFALPPIVRAIAEKQATAALGRQVSIARVRFNPFSLGLSIEGLRIAGAPGEQSNFFELDRLHTGLELFASIWYRGPVLNPLQISHPQVHVVREADNRFNFSDILDRFAAAPKAAPDASPLHFSINNIELDGGRIDFEDRPVAVRHVVDQLGIGLPFLSNVPSKVQIEVTPHAEARINGSAFSLKGELKPFADHREATLDFGLQAFDVTRYLAYVPGKLPVLIKHAMLSSSLQCVWAERSAGGQTLSLRGDVSLSDVSAGTASVPALFGWKNLQIGLRDVQPLTSPPSIALSRIELDQPAMQLHRLRDGRLDLPIPASAASVPAAEKGKAAETRPEQQVKLAVDSIVIRGAQIDWRDDAVPQGFAARLAPLDLKLDGFDLQGRKPAQLSANVVADSSGQISLAGRVDAAQQTADLKIALTGLQLERYRPYYAAALGKARPSASVDASVRLAAAPGGLDGMRLSEGRLQLSNFVLPDSGAKQPVVRLSDFLVDGFSADFAKHEIGVARIESHDARWHIVRDAQGINLLDELGLAKQTGASASAQSAPASAAWIVRSDKTDIAGWQLGLEDRTGKTPVNLLLNGLSLQTAGLALADGVRGQLTLDTQVNRRGRIHLGGALGLSPLAAQMHLDARAVDLIFTQPFISNFAHVLVTSGVLDARGDLSLNTPAGQAPKIGWAGDVSISDFTSLDEINDTEFLRWKQIAANKLRVSTAPMDIAASELRIEDINTRLILDQSGKFNLREIVQSDAANAAPLATSVAADASAPAAEASSAAAASSSASASSAADAGPAMKMHIDQIVLAGGNVSFSDRFVKPGYDVRLTDLAGSLTGLSSDENALANLSVKAMIDHAAPVDIAGQLNPLRRERTLDIKAHASDIDLTSVSTYAGRYVGYGISKGKLSMNVAYQIRDRKLSAQNQLYLDQLTFGDPVDSPDATHLPVQLAVALLRDRNGVIDINLPIGGSLDDPQFSVGGIIVKVFVNLVTKAVTAPFSLLGSMFGGGEELAYVDFDAGLASLPANAQGKLESLSKALTERPGLRLDIAGSVDPARDTPGLKRAWLDGKLRAAKAALLVKRGERVSNVDALVIGKEEYPALLTAVYGDAEIDKPRNALGFAKTLSAPEMEKLLLDSNNVTQADLIALASRRAQIVRDWLVNQGKIAAVRIFVVEPRVSAKTGEPPLQARVDFSLK